MKCVYLINEPQVRSKKKKKKEHGVYDIIVNAYHFFVVEIPRHSKLLMSAIAKARYVIFRAYLVNKSLG